MVNENSKHGIPRRRFLTLGMGVAGAAAVTLTTGCGGSGTPAPSPSPKPTSGITDTDILNFALNLEYLEAEFYLLAVTGKGLSDADAGPTAGPVTGGHQVTFQTEAFQEYASKIANDELAHVRFLRQALGQSAVSRPAISLLNSFNDLAKAAGLGSTFDPFADETSFLLGTFIFEDVGVTAYHGAAGLLSDKACLNKAAGILAVEAYHAGSIRTRIFKAGQTAQDASSKIAAARASLDGTGNDDIGVGVSGGAATIVDADSNAIAFSRNAMQVLKIVYGAGTSSGAFFPNGMNGKIR